MAATDAAGGAGGGAGGALSMSNQLMTGELNQSKQGLNSAVEAARGGAQATLDSTQIKATDVSPANQTSDAASRTHA